MLKESIPNSSEKRFKNTKETKAKAGARTVRTGGSSIPNPVFFLMIVYNIFLYFPLKSYFFFKKYPFFFKKRPSNHKNLLKMKRKKPKITGKNGEKTLKTSQIIA